jgi:hypothetical protein
MTRRTVSTIVDPLVSVVIPAYNERDTIEEIVRRVVAVPLRIELVVVDDGSTDGTGHAAGAPTRARLRARVPAQRGKGSARGRFHACDGEHRGHPDADPGTTRRVSALIDPSALTRRRGTPRDFWGVIVFLFTHYLATSR